MRSVLLLALKNLRKKRLQNSLIAIIIGVSALILSTGIGMLQSFDSPVEKVFKELNSSQTVLYIPDNLYDIQDLKGWWLRQPGVSGVAVYPSYITNTKATIKSVKVDKSLRFSEREDIDAEQDKLTIVDGEKKRSPAAGEIWIPTGFAYSYHVKVGDIINIPTPYGEKPAKVSAIVVDPHSSSSFQGTIRIWVASGEIMRIFNSKSNNTVMGIYYADYSKSDQLWKSFEEYLKAPFGGFMMGYNEFQALYTDLFKISASILVLFSLVVILCAVFVIAFTISNSILADYKVIGILKAQGFTSRQIQACYLIQFILILLVSVPLGVTASYLCINIIMASLLKAVGITSVHTSMLLPFIITLSIILLVICISAWISSRKTCRIKPSDAIKSGAPESSLGTGTHINIIKLKRLSLPLSVGIKQALTYKKQSFFIIVTLLLTSFVFTGTVNAYNTLFHLGENLPYWGLDNSEVTVEFPSEVSAKYTEGFVNGMKKDSRVKGILPWCWSRAAYRTTSDASKILETMAYDGDMNSVGITNLRGRNPITRDEVALAINTSKDMKKDIGDSVEIYIQGVKKTLLVTGIYQSMMNGGTGLRLQMKAMEGQLGNYDGVLYAIKLKPGTDADDFIKYLQATYTQGINVKHTFDVYKSFITSTTDNLSYALIFLFLVFTAVTFIVIFNITLITIYQQRKDLGILKAVGMTNGEIRSSIAYKTLITGILGTVLGVPLGLIFIPRIMNLLVSSMGLVSLPFVISPAGTLGVAALSAVIILLGVLISSGKVMQIKLMNLISE